MTVSVQENSFRYTGNGVTTVFAFSCQVLAEDDLYITVDEEEVTSGFTVAGIGEEGGGTVTFSTAPESGVIVGIDRIVELKRDTDYQQNGDFRSAVVNPDFDRIWMALQQLGTLLGASRGAAGRVLKLGQNDTNGSGAYRALDNRIQDLADPLAEQDAVNKRTALDLIETYIADLPSGNGTFIQGGDGSITRTFQSKLRESPTPRDFGCVGDRVTDDTDGMQKYFIYCAANGYNPRINGRFLLSDKIYGVSNFAFSVMGEGTETSQLLFVGSDGGLELDFSSAVDYEEGGSTSVHNLAILAGAPFAGAALKVIHNDAAGDKRRGDNYFNLGIGKDHRLATNRNYWTKGLHLVSAKDATISNSHFVGRIMTGVAKNGEGIYMEGNCTGAPVIAGTRFHWWYDAITKANGATDATEGTEITNCIMVVCNYGVRLDDSGVSGNPALRVLSCHMNTYNGGIYTNQRSQTYIAGNLFYRRSDATASYVDIELNGKPSHTIISNQFINTGTSGTATGIKLVNVTDAVVTGNLLQGAVRHYGLTADATCSDIIVKDNHFKDAITKEVDLGGMAKTEYCVTSSRAPGYAIVTYATQTLTTSVEAAITYSAISADETITGIWNAATPTRLTVPVGVSRVRLTAGVLFASNATGRRRARILKNGLAFNGMAESTVAPVNGSITSFQVITPILDVAAGDYFEVYAFQSSGGNLDLTAGNSGTFNMEIIA